jgi:hypothetical protein
MDTTIYAMTYDESASGLVALVLPVGQSKEEELCPAGQTPDQTTLADVHRTVSQTYGASALCVPLQQLRLEQQERLIHNPEVLALLTKTAEGDPSSSPVRHTLLDIHHPAFREGYQQGREHFFQKQIIFTDKQFVECLLEVIFEEDEPQAPEEEIYAGVGRLLGQMSGGVVARLPHEQGVQNPQEAFLSTIRQQHTTTGQALVQTIQLLWAAQDQLAQTLDANTFEQMCQRGVDPCLGRC